MITTLDIMQYKAGWLEEHPDEELDDATVMSCLQDERHALIEKLTNWIIEAMQNNKSLSFADQVRQLLREGCDGYENRSVAELWKELNQLGLTL